MPISISKGFGTKGKRARSRTRSVVICGFFFAAVVATAIPALAEHTRWWKQDSFDDFNKGTAKGVALRSDGKLFLAPKFAEFADANLAYLLVMRADAKGNIYAAGGSNAKVVRFDANGKASKVFESSELAAQALAIDSSGNVYVGTSPDGKVYKVTPSGQSSVFFDPKTKYIWDLAVDKDGSVYVATGDTGKIFVVAPDGKGQIFYSSDETHIRSLALDSNGNVLAGTEPSGEVLRIPKAGNPRRAFVLYETSKKEITALLQDASGNLYVAAVGEKTPPVSGSAPQTIDTGTSQTLTMTFGPGGTSTIASPVQAQPYTPLPTVNSSTVYKIATDGSASELWNSRDDVVYALAFLPNGKLLLGTGNQGQVIELNGNLIFSRLVKSDARQITSIAVGTGGKLFLAAANPGKVFTLGPENESEGTFESQPFDAHIFSRWGRIDWWGNNATSGKGANGASIEFFARSGNTSDPESNWSAWAGPYSSASGGKIDCPPARFVQWKAVLNGTTSGEASQIDWVSLAYLPKNLAPDVTAIAIQNPGVRVQPIALGGSGPQTSVQLKMPQPPGSGSNAVVSGIILSTVGTSHLDAIPQGYSQKGWESVLWTAEDDNDDPLLFSIYFRRENETLWSLLKDKVDARFYSWDSTAMPDGAYYLKIVATDAPSNPEGEGLSGELESGRFVVANTPPVITHTTAESTASGVRVRFEAADAASIIARAQYSVDAGDWVMVFPTGGLSDASKESYDFQLKQLSPGEHTITVRVYDEYENVSSAEATVHVPASKN